MKQQIITEDIKKQIKLIFDTFETLKQLNKDAKVELSEIDKELSNQYHKIEGVEIQYMTDAHFLMMNLRDILEKRREAKINQTILESFISSLGPQITKTKKRNTEIINKHSEILQEIINRAK